MSKIKKSVTEAVSEIAAPLAESLGFKLWDIKFVKEGANWYLRVFIDKDDGISLEDCEKMSKALNEPLDILDPIDISYCLEVCSPGIERELCKNEHFEKFIGSDLRIQLFSSKINGKKTVFGKLKKYDEEKITILTDENEILEILRKNISKINLKVLEERI